MDKWLKYCHILVRYFLKKQKVTDTYEAHFILIPDPISFPFTPEATTLLRLAQRGIISINLCICCLSHGTEFLKSRHNLLINVVSPVPAQIVSDRYDR